MMDRNRDGHTSTITSSDNPCEMNKSMGSLDGVEAFRRRLINDKNKLYKARIPSFFALLEDPGNQGKRMVPGVPFCSICQKFFAT